MLSAPVAMSQNICQPFGDLVVYSNYDGGFLNIDVDEDIPGLTIGVVSYESVNITITGEYAANVSRLVYAGFNATNSGCGFGSSIPSTFNVEPGTEVIDLFAPPVTFQSPFGNQLLICAYSCAANTSQGGCNTAEQVALYFQDTYDVLLRSHHVQYDCWMGLRFVSDGGNCCAGAITTAVDALPGAAEALRVDVLGDHITVFGSRSFDVLDAGGRIIASVQGDGHDRRTVATYGWATGAYLVREHGTGRVARFGLVR